MFLFILWNKQWIRDTVKSNSINKGLVCLLNVLFDADSNKPQIRNTLNSAFF